MSNNERIELSVLKEQAILVGVILPDDDRSDYEDPLEELASLSRTAGATVVGALTQKRQKPDAAFFLGKGKAEEVGKLVEANDANVIITDNNLSPAQVRNLEKITGTKVVDRTELILDIFATRAKTSQARLQVELAQMQYLLPRLRRMWTHLDTYEGGIGTRGPGEKQLEMDRRIIRKRITDLGRELKEIEGRKQRQVAKRKEVFQVSLVGYTNAGKSTLMNRLTDSDVLVEDRLFSTLDTRTRVWPIAKGKTILLSDTVGFLRRLPHNLVASFHATLEEAANADLLLHVIDASHPQFERQIKSVVDVLEELELSHKPQLMVFNKSDDVRDLVYVKAAQEQYENSVLISAATGDRIDDLRQIVLTMYDEFVIEAELVVSATNGKLLSILAHRSDILKQEFEGNQVRMRTRIDRRFLEQLLNEQRGEQFEVVSIVKAR
ncbi:MAG: GTPase HflX [Planctomycetota bacterium]|nr:GTPase HflX [Planctomycetota bacterium]